jgi:hypothetical protein
MDERFEAVAELVASEDTELIVGEIGGTGCERGIGTSSSWPERAEGEAEGARDPGRDAPADSALDFRCGGALHASSTSALVSVLKRSSSLSLTSAYKDSGFGVDTGF